MPLDIVVREDLSRLVPVLDAAPLARYGELGGGVDALPVLRIASSAGQAEGITGVTVLGLPPSWIPRSCTGGAATTPAAHAPGSSPR